MKRNYPLAFERYWDSCQIRKDTHNFRTYWFLEKHVAKVTGGRATVPRYRHSACFIRRCN